LSHRFRQQVLISKIGHFGRERTLVAIVLCIKELSEHTYQK